MPQENRLEEPEDSSNIIEGLLAKYLPYWPLFLIMILLSVCASFIYIRYATPIYETSSKILIKDEKKGLDESKIMESFDLFGSKKIVENEIEIIKSVDLTSQVVKNLRLYAPIVREGRLKNFSAYQYSPISVEVLNPDSLIETKKVHFLYDFERKSVTVNGKTYSLFTWINFPFGTIRFLPNPNYHPFEGDKPLYFDLVSVYRVANNLLDRIEVESVSKQATIIYLRLRDEDPVRSRNILDELITVYNRAAIEDINILSANTLKFVNERLRFVVNDIDSIESSIQRYKNKNNIFDISNQGQILLESAQETDSKAVDNALQMAVLDKVQQHLISGGDTTAINPSTLGMSDPMLATLLSKLYEAEFKYANLKKSTAENNPLLLSLNEEIASIKPVILQSISSQKESLKTQEIAMNRERNKFSSVLKTLPEKERQLLQISRQQAIKNSIYTFLLQKREETALSLASTVAESRLIDKAYTSLKPISPRKTIVILIGLIFSVIATILFISVKEGLNRNILFKTDIESLSQVPIIGEISLDDSKNSIVIGQGKRNFISEQFRQLRTSLSYLGINKSKKRILLTSTISGEGKSFITANLGISISLADKKVILIELDLRKPKLSEIFGISREIGMTSYFLGEQTPEEIIKSIDSHPNLFIIPSGPIPPNPSELLMNDKLEELLIYLEKKFDFIIIDTAPVNPVTDAFILSPICDATLFIIRHKVTPKSFIKSFDLNRKVRPLKNVAFIFNGIQSRGFGKEYGYGYGTGTYGYETEIKTKKYS